MPKSALSVTVAISAHNEQDNISYVLKNLLQQRRSNFKLNSIIVACDGCTDNTYNEAKLVKSPLIKIKDDHLRKGKNARINEFIKNLNSDILVICDADIIFSNSRALDNLIKEFKVSSPALVCGNHVPLSPHNFIQRLGFFGYQIWHTARKSLGSKAIRYYSEGAFQALTYDFAKSIILPVNKPIDDSYFFYFAVSTGHSVRLASTSTIFFKLPETLSEYIYQIKRYISAPKQSHQYFDTKIVRKFEVITPAVKWKSFINCAMKSPFISLIYIYIQIFIKLQMFTYIPPVIWTTATTTKRKIK